MNIGFHIIWDTKHLNEFQTFLIVLGSGLGLSSLLLSEWLTTKFEVSSKFKYILCGIAVLLSSFAISVSSNSEFFHFLFLPLFLFINGFFATLALRETYKILLSNFSQDNFMFLVALLLTWVELGRTFEFSFR